MSDVICKTDIYNWKEDLKKFIDNIKSLALSSENEWACGHFIIGERNDKVHEEISFLSFFEKESAKFKYSIMIVEPNYYILMCMDIDRSDNEEEFVNELIRRNEKVLNYLAENG